MSDMDQSTDPSGVIIFDTTSGISLEEQQEILDGINTASNRNRLVSEAVVTEAKKKDYHFPLLINIAAIVIFALGSLLLTLFYRHDVEAIRESSSALGITERKLIQEIREETSALIREKERQINDVLLRYRAAEEEYRTLSDSVESLTEAQQRRVNALMIIQDEYRGMLSSLESEKAFILEESRLREARLRASAEESVEGLSRELGTAMEELRALGAEQELVARVENQIAGFYRTLDNQLRGGRIAEAGETLKAMRDFLNAPSFQGIPALEARKQAYLLAISAFEKAIPLSGEAAQGQNLEELVTQNAALAQRAANLERDLNALNSQGSDQTRIISEYISAIQELEATNEVRQQTLAQRDNEIQSLTNEIQSLTIEVDAKDQQVSALNSNLGTLRAQYEDLRRRMEEALAIPED